MDDSIDLKLIYKKIKTNIKLLFLINISLVTMALIYTISLPNEFTSSAKVELRQDPNSNEGTRPVGGLNSLFGGISLGNSSGNIYSLMEFIQSRDFYKNHFYINENFVEKLKIANGLDKQEEISFLESYDLFNTNLSMSFDENTQLLDIFYTSYSADFSQFAVQQIITSTNEEQKKQKKYENEQSIAFISDQIVVSTNQNLIEAFSQLLQDELKKNILVNIFDDYPLKTVDSPYIPEKKSSTSKAVLMIFFILLSSILSVIIILLRSNKEV